MWFERTGWKAKPPVLVIGECKSFGDFKSIDFKRADHIRREIPGAILVFATLKSELNEFERGKLVQLAMAGRTRVRDRKPRNPVMILTGHELCSMFGIPGCWASMDSRAKRIAKDFRDTGGLLEICDLTQQIHLGMDSFAVFRRAELDRMFPMSAKT